MHLKTKKKKLCDSLYWDICFIVVVCIQACNISKVYPHHL